MKYLIGLPVILYFCQFVCVLLNLMFDNFETKKEFLLCLIPFYPIVYFIFILCKRFIKSFKKLK